MKLRYFLQSLGVAMLAVPGFTVVATIIQDIVQKPNTFRAWLVGGSIGLGLAGYVGVALWLIGRKAASIDGGRK